MSSSASICAYRWRSGGNLTWKELVVSGFVVVVLFFPVGFKATRNKEFCSRNSFMCPCRVSLGASSAWLCSLCTVNISAWSSLQTFWILNLQYQLVSGYVSVVYLVRLWWRRYTSLPLPWTKGMWPSSSQFTAHWPGLLAISRSVWAFHGHLDIQVLGSFPED